MLVIAALIQWNSAQTLKASAQIQEDSLTAQKYFSEINSRPYLVLDVQNFDAVDTGTNISFRLKLLLSNKGKVPATKVMLQKIGSIVFEEERNYDIVPGQDLLLHISGKFDKPIENNYLIAYFTYSGIPLNKEQKRNYSTLFAAKLGLYKEKIIYDPIAIKIDDDAFLFKESFVMLNPGKLNHPPIWPKLR
jgi:hypothetical protein